MDKSISQIITLLARRSQSYLGNLLEEYNITAAEQPFFLEMNRREGLTQEELTAYVCVDKAATTRALKSLEAKGYLVRIKDEKDKRQNRIYPTKKARELETAVRSELLCFHTRLTQGIEPQALDLIYSGLLKMEENISGFTGEAAGMMMKNRSLDGRSTMEDWPVKIWNVHEIPWMFREYVYRFMETDFSKYEFVYVPRQYANSSAYSYLYGYGENKILYLQEKVSKLEKGGEEENYIEHIEIGRKQIREVLTVQELLDARIVLFYWDGEKHSSLELPYNASTYYLYNPFLNWILGLESDFKTILAEQKNPRPQELGRESLAMYNYSLNAYRLGAKFETYTYKAEPYMSAGKDEEQQLKEWLTVPMERGQFEVYKFGYRTECRYRLGTR